MKKIIVFIVSIVALTACNFVTEVSDVKLNKNSIRLTPGQVETLTATVNPADAFYDRIEWTSSNSAVATVSGGQVTALSIGSTNIVASANGVASSPCVVTVEGIPVIGVTLGQRSIIMTEGDTRTLTAVIAPTNATNKTVIWYSSNTLVAVVSQSGEVIAKSAGTAAITVKTDDGGKTDICEVTVQAKKVYVTEVALSTSSLSMTEGDTQTLTATVSPSNATDKSVTWSSSNTSVATVSSSGVVTAQKAGTATITAKTNDGGKTATCAVTVQAKKISVTGVSLNKSSISMIEGDTQTLTATITPSNATDKSVTWSSSNSSVAAVSSSGVVSAKTAGSAIITAKTNDGGKTATCAVTVQAKKVSVTGVTLNKTSLSMTEGDTQTLTATITPSNATNKNVSWISSNSSVATVNSNGSVSAVKVGTAVITATTEDGGKSASCMITVKPISVTGVSLNQTNLTMIVGDTQTLSATVIPSNATDKSVSWTSSNTAVATVSSSGVVSAKATGNATITVTTTDGGNTSSCSIKVVEYNRDYVDLGLPSGLKWATCNIGATSPEQGGNKYAWGEIETKSIYWWSTYKWCNFNSSNNSVSLTKYYNSSSSKLENADDVAYIKLGWKWRMPTNADWTELQLCCTWTWTTQNGVYGELVTGPNGNSIFLPSAGLDRYGDYGYAGGYYWSSSLSINSIEKAWSLSFYSSNISRGVAVRYSGFSIRPVYSE